MSDYDYNPDICRNISLDIRYVLFLLEKYGEADNIIEELKLVHDHQPEQPVEMYY
jgi:hypothetical protein